MWSAVRNFVLLESLVGDVVIGQRVYISLCVVTDHDFLIGIFAGFAQSHAVLGIHVRNSRRHPLLIPCEPGFAEHGHKVLIDHLVIQPQEISEKRMFRLLGMQISCQFICQRKSAISFVTIRHGVLLSRYSISTERSVECSYLGMKTCLCQKKKFLCYTGGVGNNSSFIVTPMDKVKIENHSFTGFSWFAGWLFTIGFLNLSFGKGLLAVILWPYYIGQYVSALVGN